MKTLFLLGLLLFTSNTDNAKEVNPLCHSEKKIINGKKNYWTVVQEVKSSLETNSNSDNFSDTLHHHLSSSIFPQWYGVEWDYNGYTNDPSEGQIACGYFVSTTLKHIGFNLNRYDLAKQYSLSIVKSLDQDFRKFKSIEPTLEFIDSQVDQLYVVGLSNHVGFLSKEKGKIYFVHSNYMEPVAVEKELASESEALRSSNVFVLGKISHNEALNEKYKKKTKIDILD